MAVGVAISTLLSAQGALAGGVTAADLFACKQSIDRGNMDAAQVGRPMVLAAKTDAGTTTYTILSSAGVENVNLTMPIEGPKFASFPGGDGKPVIFRFDAAARNFVPASDKEALAYTKDQAEADYLKSEADRFKAMYDEANKDCTPDKRALARKNDDANFKQNEKAADACGQLPEECALRKKCDSDDSQAHKIYVQYDKKQKEYAATKFAKETIARGTPNKTTELQNGQGCDALALGDTDGYKQVYALKKCSLHLPKAEYAIQLKQLEGMSPDQFASSVCGSGRLPRDARMDARTRGALNERFAKEQEILIKAMDKFSDDAKKQGITDTTPRIGFSDLKFTGVNGVFSNVTFTCRVGMKGLDVDSCSVLHTGKVGDVKKAVARLTSDPDGATSKKGACEKLRAKNYCGDPSDLAKSSSFLQKNSYLATSTSGSTARKPASTGKRADAE
jgi:hypothetical protein